MNECEVPILEQLLSIPENARQMVEISEFHHRNIPYGALCNKAAKEIKALEEKLKEAREALKEVKYEMHPMFNFVDRVAVRDICDKTLEKIGGGE